MEPQYLLGQPYVYADDHCGRPAGLLEQRLHDVTGEDDCFGRVRWSLNCDLPSTVVLDRFGHKLSRDCAGGLGGGFVGTHLPCG